MRFFFVTVLVFLAGFAASPGAIAAEEKAAAPPARVDFENSGENWKAVVRFADASKPPVVLVDSAEGDAPPWKPSYSVSPDGRWIVCVQKIGSGQNVAFLFSVDEHGRVFRLVQGLDELAWSYSDTLSKTKRENLFHTALDDVKWTGKHTLRFRLGGAGESKDTPGVDLRLEYDPQTNAFKKAG